MKRAIAFLLPFALPLSAFAAELLNPLYYTSLYDFLIAILNLVALIAFPVLVLFLIYIGFLFVQAEGDPAKLKTARGFFFWAIVGALLVLGGKALAIAIQATVADLSQGV